MSEIKTAEQGKRNATDRLLTDIHDLRSALVDVHDSDADLAAAIDTHLIEIGRLVHPKVGEALEMIVARADRS